MDEWRARLGERIRQHELRKKAKTEAHKYVRGRKPARAK
jgi:hypothetical protein